MTSMLGSNRRRHGTPKSRPRRHSLQKPNGVIGPRVQKVSGEHFAIVCVDPAKHRPKGMMADYSLRTCETPCRILEMDD